MYLFGISIHEHVPLTWVLDLDFFQGRASSGFSRGGSKTFLQGPKVAKLHFHHSKLRKQPFLQKHDEKMSNFKILGGVGPLFDAHVPKTSHDKKSEGITKMYLPINIYSDFWNKHSLTFILIFYSLNQTRSPCSTTTQIGNNRHRTFSYGVVGRITG